MFGDGVGIGDALGPDAPGSRPALRFGAAVDNHGAAAVRRRVRVPVETVALPRGTRRAGRPPDPGAVPVTTTSRRVPRRRRARLTSR